MSSNIKEFELGLQTFAERNVPEAVGDFRDAVAEEAVRGVMWLTPVDTGRLRGNWQVTVSQPAEGDRNVTDVTGSGEQGVPVIDATDEGLRVVASAEGRPFEPIWLHNGVDYAEDVNDGTENLPAVHMVEQTVQLLERKFGT